MPNAVVLGGFVVVATSISFGWGRALWYFADRSQATRGWVFFAMRYTRRQFSEVRALVLGAIYYTLGLLASGLLAVSFRLPVSSLFSFKASYIALSLIGIVGEISLANLLIELSVRLTGTAGPERFAEIGEVPWIKGLRQLPPAAVPVAAACGGVVEEIFFRGAVLGIMMDRLSAAPMIAVAVAGILFVFQQLIQVRTAFQAMVIGSSCVAISLVGGILVVFSGSILPALISHGSFVLFFMAQGGGAAPSSYPTRAEMTTR
jgi:membrane protease YdiL (CAAX protease family)